MTDSIGNDDEASDNDGNRHNKPMEIDDNEYEDDTNMPIVDNVLKCVV